MVTNGKKRLAVFGMGVWKRERQTRPDGDIITCDQSWRDPCVGDPCT